MTYPFIEKLGLIYHKVKNESTGGSKMNKNQKHKGSAK
jgi:hypothetical protein